MLLEEAGTGALRVAIVAGSGLSPSRSFTGSYKLTRVVADGSAILEVAGESPVTFAANSLPPSSRPGVKTVEFGTYDVRASSVTRWTTLGLPAAASPIGLSFKDVRLKDVDARDSVRIVATFTLDTFSDGADPATSPASSASTSWRRAPSPTWTARPPCPRSRTRSSPWT